ncbi:hypothetical protein GQR58_001073 [Nymphon striatum]|nr:hypothetical protein GQR58_001073 [Nymphon striatum]
MLPYVPIKPDMLQLMVEELRTASNKVDLEINLNQDVTIENFFMYLENPPAPCSKIVKLGGIPCKGLNGINTTDGDKIVCENPAKPIPHRNCIIYSLGLSLVLHIKHANYVAKIWRSSLTSWLDAEEITESGWLADGETYWVDDIFPLEIEEILCDQAYNADDDFDEEDEQSSSDDDN